MALDTVTCDCGRNEMDDEGWCLHCGGMALPRPRAEAGDGAKAADRDEWGARTKARFGSIQLPTVKPRVVLTVVSALAIVGVTLYGVKHRGVDAPTPQRGTAAVPGTETVPADVGRPVATTPMAGDVAQLEAWVQGARGLPFSKPVDVRVLDDATFDRQIATSLQVRAAHKSATEQVMRAMGLLSGGPDLAEATTDIGVSPSVVASYDARTKLLALRDRPLSSLTRSLIVRELVRAVDDQHFDLWRPELFNSSDESELAFRALADGDADRLQEAYIAQLPVPDRNAAFGERDRQAQAVDAGPISKALLDILGFPYTAGRPFTAALLQRGGQAALDAAFTKPPTTSEQVLHPERFAAGEGPKPVKEPTASDNAVTTDKGSIGELGLRLLFENLVGPDAARVAAEGWGGDRYVAWRNDFQSCMRINVQMDEPSLLPKLFGPLNTWDARQPDADFKAGRDGVSISACR